MTIPTLSTFPLAFVVLVGFVVGCNHSAEYEADMKRAANEEATISSEKPDQNDEVAESPLNENGNEAAAKNSNIEDEKLENSPPLNFGGTVTYNGKSIAGAKVEFTNEAGVAIGTTDGDGKFKLDVAKGVEGNADVRIGTLKINVGKQEAEIDPSGKDNKLLESVIPVKLSEPNGTELKVEILKDGKTDINIELNDD